MRRQSAEVKPLCHFLRRNILLRVFFFFYFLFLGEQWIHGLPEAEPPGDPEGGGTKVSLSGGEALRPHSVPTVSHKQGIYTLSSPAQYAAGLFQVCSKCIYTAGF